VEEVPHYLLKGVALGTVLGVILVLGVGAALALLMR